VWWDKPLLAAFFSVATAQATPRSPVAVARSAANATDGRAVFLLTPPFISLPSNKLVKFRHCRRHPSSLMEAANKRYQLSNEYYWVGLRPWRLVAAGKTTATTTRTTAATSATSTRAPTSLVSAPTASAPTTATSAATASCTASRWGLYKLNAVDPWLERPGFNP
jgi:hypothetical protein